MEKSKRGVGPKRCVRKSISMTNETEGKLNRLAVACHMSPAELATILLEAGLNSEGLIQWLQNKYNRNPQYRVIPIKENGRIIY